MDRGSTSTVGTVLLVGLVVVASVAISAFVLGLAGETTDEDPAPTASLDVNITDDGNATITHEGGDKIRAGTLKVRGTESTEPIDEPLTAGETVDAGKIQAERDVLWVVADERHVVATKTVPGIISVTIESTNSPIDEGNTLEVTANFTNEGETELNETARLDILDNNDESVAIAEQTDLSLDVGESTTETLEWSTSSGDDGSYTALVRTDKGADSADVEVQDTGGGSGGSGGSSGGLSGGVPAFNLPALVIPVVLAVVVGLREGLLVVDQSESDHPEEEAPDTTATDSDGEPPEQSEGAGGAKRPGDEATASEPDGDEATASEPDGGECDLEG